MTTYILNGLQLLLDRTHFTAEVIKIKDTNDIVFIPKSVFYDFEEYIITQIAQGSFIANGVIKRIIFDKDSKIFYIGEKAFSYLSLTNIIIPRHVNYIGEDCFNKCNYLQKVDFEEDSELRSIEKNTFNQSSINSLYIPSSVEELKDGWCSGTTNLFNISISPNNKNFIYLNNSMIVGKSDKNSDNFDSLFFVRRDIEKIEIPACIKHIKSYALGGCLKLSSIQFSEDSQLVSIEKFAFEFSGIKTIVIPKHVKRMDEFTFSNCFCIENIEFAENSELCSFNNNLFFNSTIHRLIGPSSLIEMKDDWCASVPCLYEFHIPESNKHFKSFNGNLVLGKSDPNSQNYDVLVFASRRVDSGLISPSIKIIKPYAFSHCENLKDVSSPENSELVSIGHGAFSNSTIESICIPTHVKMLGLGALYDCSNLKRITFSKDSEFLSITPDIFKQIYECVFIEKQQPLKTFPKFFKKMKKSFNATFESLYVPSNIIEFKDGWCSGARKLINVSISPNNKCFMYIDNKMIVGKSDPESSIYDNLIFVRRDIETITIPSFIKCIKPFAFAHCTNLKTVIFTENSELESIERNAFNKSTIESICIPSHVKSLGKKSFAFTCNLTIVTFSENSELDIISEYAFYNSSLAEITIPASVSQIGMGAFQSCEKLNTFIFEEDIKLKKIEASVFSAAGFDEITIPRHVQHIESRAFAETYSMTTVNFEENSELLVIGNEAFYNSAVESIEIPRTVVEICESAFLYCSILKTVTFEEGSEIVSIGRSAFNRSGIENISFPRSLKVIKRGTLQECEALETVSFPEDSELEIIEKNAFKFSSLKNLIIPKKVKIMQEGWCNGTESLENIEVSPENGIIDYDDSQNALYEYIQKDDGIEVNLSFVDRSNDYFYVLPVVVHINDYAFTDCMSLECIEFDEKSKVVSIGRKALYGAPIRNIVTPKSTNKFGSELFGECRKLVSAEFLGDDLIFGESCFNLCNGLLLISFPNANRAIISIHKKYHNQLSLFTRPNAKIYNNMKI